MAIIPVKNLTTEDILYGDRNTQYRWEVLEHSNGVDYLVGTLDGVSDGSLSWVQNAAVKGRGKMEVIDLDAAQPGMLRIGELALESARIRPVMTLNSGDMAGSYQDVWTESDRNRFTQPNPATAAMFPAARAAVTFVGSGESRYALAKVSDTTGAVYFNLTSAANRVPVTPGETIKYSIETSGTGGYARNLRLFFMNAAGGYLPGSINGPTASTGVWGVQTVEGVVPDGAAFAGVYILTTATALNLELYVRRVYAGTKGTYYTGDTVTTVPYRRYSWTGVANASASIEEVRQQQWISTGTVIPEIPWGTFLLEKSSEEWEDTGRVWKLSMLDRTTVPSQDVVDQSYAVAAGTNILQEVRAILATSGEYMAVDQSVDLATRSGMVWEAGTSKLKIINDLLDAAGYNSLWMDGWGNFQATPRVLPADRSIEYELLTGVSRELVDGSKSIYSSDWTRERDSFGVPNKVIAIQSAGGEDDEALVGQWTNEDPASPYSYPSRGRWVPWVLDSVDCPEGTEAEILAFLQARARATLVQMSAVQAEVKVEHLPIPVRVGDVLRFANTRAGIDARHVITRLDLETSPTGLMKSTLQEVISL